MTQEQKHTALQCPFCGSSPKIFQNKIYHCQLHGEPSQSVRVECSNNNCPSKPGVSAGDCYNHASTESFQDGKRKATQQAIQKWNIRANDELKAKAEAGVK